VIAALSVNVSLYLRFSGAKLPRSSALSVRVRVSNWRRSSPD